VWYSQNMPHSALSDKDRIVRYCKSARKARYLNLSLVSGNGTKRHGVAISQLVFMHHNRMRHIQIVDDDMIRRLYADAFIRVKAGQVDGDNPAVFF
jgi:hypothetical protein